MQEGKKESPTMQGRGSDLNKKLSSTKVRKKPYRKSQAVKELEAIATTAARTIEDFYTWYNEKFCCDER